MKTVDLHVRPVFHCNAQRVRAHVFLCMLGYYVEWHMRERLKPMLFDDEYLVQAHAFASFAGRRGGSFAASEGQGHEQARTRRTAAAQLRTLLQDLTTLADNITRTERPPR